MFMLLYHYRRQSQRRPWKWSNSTWLEFSHVLDTRHRQSKCCSAGVVVFRRSTIQIRYLTFFSCSLIHVARSDTLYVSLENNEHLRHTIHDTRVRSCARVSTNAGNGLSTQQRCIRSWQIAFVQLSDWWSIRIENIRFRTAYTDGTIGNRPRSQSFQQ